MKKLIDLTGRRFGRLVVLRREGTRYYVGEKRYWAVPTWRCRCDCGKECTVNGNNLRTGRTRSCGCLRGDVIRARNSMARKKR